MAQCNDRDDNGRYCCSCSQNGYDLGYEDGYQQGIDDERDARDDGYAGNPDASNRENVEERKNEKDLLAAVEEALAELKRRADAREGKSCQ